jgi:dTDP-4-dehydrorhamnose reductase
MNKCIFHIATPSVTSRLEWARTIAEIFNYDVSLILPTKSTQNKGVAIRPKYSLIEPSKIEGIRNDWLIPPKVSLSHFFAS